MLVLKQMDRITIEKVWCYVSIGLSGIGGAAVAGALRALVEEVRKLRWGLFQVNDLRREVTPEETRTEPSPSRSPAKKERVQAVANSGISS